MEEYEYIALLPKGFALCHVGQLNVQTRVQAVRTGRERRKQVGSHRKDEGELPRVPDTTGRGGHVCGEQAQVQGGSRNYRDRMMRP